MSDDIVIAVDAMGGDNAPRMVVQGLNRYLARSSGVRFILFGRADDLASQVRKYRRLRDDVDIRHTDVVVSPSDRPSVALRSGRQSSMRHALDAVSAGEAQGALSAGNTGALMAMAKFVLRTLPGIDRPAIASVFPTQRGRTVVLDLGANIECSSENLVQFAVMGEVYARNVLGIAQPTVGLLNVGAEELKGHDALREAATVLRANAKAFDFHGFVEGNDIGRGVVDVIVTDGFTGNVALKTMEGTARLYTHLVRECVKASWLARIGMVFAQPALRKLRRRVDPRYYNGAMLLGLNGVCVKSHGGTDGVGFASAVKVTVDLVADAVNDGIKQDFATFRPSEKTDLRVMAGS